MARRQRLGRQGVMWGGKRRARKEGARAGWQSRLAARLEWLERRDLLTATDFSATLLKDINTSAASSTPFGSGDVISSGSGNEFVTIGNEVYFAARDQAHGTELFKTDGVTTTLVKDIVPGAQSSDPTNLTNVDGTLYFTVTSPSGAESLWSSDGTDADTRLVGSLPGATYVSQLTAVDNKLFFVTYNNFGGSELWVSDGTAPAPLYAFNSGQTVSSLVSVNDELYFAFNQGGSSPVGKLGFSDGSAPHTTFVSGTSFSSIGQLETVTTTGASGSSQTLFFAADDAANGNSLWRYDGASFATVVKAQPNTVIDLTAVAGSLYFVSGASNDLFWLASPGISAQHVTANVYQVVNANGTLFFTETSSPELFAILQAGTPAASAPVDQKTFWTLFGLNPSDILNQEMFFPGPSGGLYRADGSPADVAPLTTSDPTPKTVYQPYSSGAAAVNGKLLFFATTNASLDGAQLWESDGTTTTQLPAINTGTEGSTPYFSEPYLFSPSTLPSAVNVGGVIYFAANSGSSGAVGGYDLYVTNGTQAGTSPVASSVIPSSLPAGLTQLMWNMNGHLVYVDNSKNDSLSTVNPEGTISPLLGGVGQVSAVTQVGATWYFIATPSGGQPKLYATDGTPTGTKLVSGTNAPANVFAAGLATLGDSKTVYFLAAAPSAPADSEVFAYNGSTATPIRDVGGSLMGFTGTALTSSGANLIVTPTLFGTPTLWISNGSSAGTQQISFGSAAPPDMILTTILPVNGGYVFDGFTFDSSGYHFELWKIDTTTSPPTASVLSSLGLSGSGAVYLDDFEQAGAFVTFNAITSAGTQLWTTDGTAADTVPLDSFSSESGSAPSDFTPFNGKLYFVADDGMHGSQLWATNGTAAGTAAITDVSPNESTGGFNPSNLAVIGSQLFMSGNDGVHGDEPWLSDGSGGGTTLAVDIAPGAGGSGPSGFTALGNGQIFLRADDGTDGSEPFVLMPLPPQALVASAVLGFTETAGATFTHAVATFTDPNGAAALSDYSATVDWGDGQTDSNAAISGP
ncbi:MAG TPA: hypothetical protein VNH11_03245, partial [Pirellulales bacterium]|nr:hypothetical protein [Pirellulales bacterium]